MDWSQLIYCLCYLFVSVLATVVVKEVLPLISQKVASSEYSDVVETVYYAVRSAEQAMWKDPGKAKKEYVVNLVQPILQSKGINWSAEQLDAIIEAAVFEVKQEIKE